MELIDREDAMQAVRNLKEIMLTNAEVINALYHVPTIESRPRGKWQRKHPSLIYECSNCHDNMIAEKIEWFKYCPTCGAEMEVE